MLYKFRSRDAGDVIMLEANGRQILDIIGKQAGPKGIILPDQMPAAIEALHAAIALEKSGHEDAGVLYPEGIGLHQRALPFINLLKMNYRDGLEVVWGV